MMLMRIDVAPHNYGVKARLLPTPGQAWRLPSETKDLPVKGVRGIQTLYMTVDI